MQKSEKSYDSIPIKNGRKDRKTDDTKFIRSWVQKMFELYKFWQNNTYLVIGTEKYKAQVPTMLV